MEFSIVFVLILSSLLSESLCRADNGYDDDVYVDAKGDDYQDGDDYKDGYDYNGEGDGGEFHSIEAAKRHITHITP